MDEDYELNFRDIVEVLEYQISDPSFDRHFEYIPYSEFDGNDNQVYSNLYSADWASAEAVSVTFCILDSSLLTNMAA